MIYETDTDMVAIWNGTAWRYLSSAVPTISATIGGTVLQTVYGSTATSTASSVTAYADTGLTATITPKSTSSKVLVIVNQTGIYKSSGNAGNGLNLKLFRGATDLGSLALAAGYTNTALENIGTAVGASVLDSPATVSATTYKTQFANQLAAAAVNVQVLGTLSTIILQEIAG
jgi:hypothetical protein